MPHPCPDCGANCACPTWPKRCIHDCDEVAECDDDEDEDGDEDQDDSMNDEEGGEG